MLVGQLLGSVGNGYLRLLLLRRLLHLKVEDVALRLCVGLRLLTVVRLIVLEALQVLWRSRCGRFVP